MRKNFTTFLSIIFLIVFINTCDTAEDETTTSTGTTDTGNGDTDSTTTDDTTTDDTTIDADGFKVETKDDFTIKWKIEGSTISVKVSAPTSGWVAVGFDPTSRMKDANIVIGYVENGEVFIRDDYGSATTAHEADTEAGGTDNLTNKSGTETNGTTEIAFTMPLDSGDSRDRILKEGTSYTIIMAYGSSDSFTIKHSTRTSTNFKL